MRKSLTVLMLMSLLATPAFSQVVLKTNFFSAATTTMNLGLEVGVASNWTVDVWTSYNPWNFNNNLRLKHFAIQPEGRYWLCESFNGQFIGLHAHWAQYNVGSLPDFSLFSKNMQEHRYEGNLWGAGFSYGYQLPIGKHWSLEGEAGLGFARIYKRKFPCADCGTVLSESHFTYLGPTKLALNVVYVF